MFSTQPINLVVEEISQNKPVVQTPITYFKNKKKWYISIRHNSIFTLIKLEVPFFRTDIIYMIYFDMKYFSVACLSIYYEKLAVKTTLKFLSLWHNSKFYCVKMPVFETHFKVLNSWFLYSQHVMTRNKFTSSYALEARDLYFSYSQVKFVYEFTIVSFLVLKNYYRTVMLFQCYVFPFTFKDFVFPLLVEVFLHSKLERIFSKIS